MAQPGRGNAARGPEIQREVIVSAGTRNGIRWRAVVLGWALAVLLGVVLSPLLGLLFRLVAPSAEGVEVAGGSVVVALVAGFAAYLGGGYLAAKLAGYSGGLHGSLTAGFGLILGAILALFLAAYGLIFAEGVALPPVSFGLSSAGLIAGLILFAVNLLGGYAGGKLGEPVYPGSKAHEETGP